MALPPSLLLIFVVFLTLIKSVFKEWKFVVVCFTVMSFTLVSMYIIGFYKTHNFFQGLQKELTQSIDRSKKTQITITKFEELPIYDESQKLISISFKVRFFSNTTLDMNIVPKVRYRGHHIYGNEFLFWFDPTEIIFDNTTAPYSIRSFYKVEAEKPHEIVFIFQDFSREYEYMSNQPGNFQIGVIFSGHTSDPLGHGQGNATIITNIIDQTGQSVKEKIAWENLHFNSVEYKLKTDNN